ncbi:hypothetical protein D8674_036826 [Pyrus ussuriensis x Pyrus communis]|uniref:Transposase MuDR plant domain-containing protein n=1 Tax=Pyrus ussuriensis x Pyrus communis TaxID=2448454 RepID=A0A5N5G9S5_9ROSA|nr:hypothetical protein D8674_036826 [Pyrus ussuriensis x Pyrus communis]
MLFKTRCSELKYSLSEGFTCLLDCDANVNNMLLVCGVVGKPLVEILVFDKFVGALVELPTDSVSFLRYTSDSTVLVSENYHLGKYGSHGNRGCADFRDMLKNFSVECGFELKYLKNDKSRINAECSRKESNGCPWRVYIDYSTAYFGKEKAISELNDDDVDSYKLLPWYIESTLASNLGYVFELEVVPKSNSILFLFEVAYAIADLEIIANWREFLSILSLYIKVSRKGDHIYNVSSLFSKGAGKGLKKKMNFLANCAYACTTSDFDDCIIEFMDNGKGHNYAITHFPGKRWGSMSNALSESFNTIVLNSRCMLLMDLLKDIRVWLMVSMAKKKLFDQNIHTILCPKKENELKLLLKEGMHWMISRSDMDVFEVSTEWNRFKATFYPETYQFVMNPVSDLDKPNVNNFKNGVRPPNTEISSRRPKKIRIKFAGEISGTKKIVTCRRCQGLGHNKVSCKVVIQDG